MRVILDHNCPRGLARLLSEHDVRTAADVGWADMSNGDLLASAEAQGFDCMVTADSNIRYQQNLTARRIALVVLSTNSWPVLRQEPERIKAAVGRAAPGTYELVSFTRPLVRRP